MEANDEEKRTVWCGNLSEKVHQKLLHELFLQAGPLERVAIPREKDGRQKNYGFIVYVHAESVPYAMELFRGTSLFQKTLNLQTKGNSKLDKTVSSYEIIARDGIPQFNDGFVNEFKAMTQQVHLKIHDRIGPSSHMKDLSVASLQGNWSARNNFNDRDRDGNKYNPYRRDDFKRHNRDYRRRDDDRSYNEPKRFRDHEKIDYSHNYRNHRNHRY